jgi:deoxyribonuclease V
VEGEAGAPYEPGLLALRGGPLLEAAVRALKNLPDVLLIDGTGRDHPRRAGIALHLGAVLDLPTVGVTHRALLASGEWPPDESGVRSEAGTIVRTYPSAVATTSVFATSAGST